MSDQEKRDPVPAAKTLGDDEIVSERGGDREVSRRSVMTAIGGVLAGGAAAAVLPGCVVRRRPGVVYTQPAPAPQAVVYAQPAQPGVVVVQPQQGRYRTNVTDSDGGAYADPAGYGRGVYGRTSGITDSDGGPYADPAGNGRGTARVGYTGLTDSDGGPYADPAGNGRGRYR